MSKFTKALEQAEQDRRNQAPPPPAAEVRPAPPPAAPRPAGPAGYAANLETLVLGRFEETLASFLDPTAFAAEQYRGLRNVIEVAAAESTSYMVAVSSPAAGDGKTVTSINLAGALAQSRDESVLLIEADLRASSIAQKLGLDPRSRRGLGDAIRDPELTLSRVARYSPQFNLSLVLAGRTGGLSPYELLRAPRFGELLAEAREHYRFIVLDTPPLVPIADCRLIEKLIDGMVVVVAADRTPRGLLEEALRVTEPSKVLGFVFNGAERAAGHYYGYYGRYDSSGKPAEDD